MRIVVHVAEEHLRGVPFKRYADVLRGLMDFTYSPDKIDILPGAKTTVTVDGEPRSKLVADVLGHVREITTPDFVDRLFGHDEWQRLYGHTATD